MMAAEFQITTNDPAETEALGGRLARLLPAGSVVALRGDLASGKTCLVRGMAAELAGDAPIHSPTFTLVNQYGKHPALYHLDLYRLNGLDEIRGLGYEELFDGDGICVVEWAERAESLLPEKRVDVHLCHGGGDQRTLHFTDHGILPRDWESHLAG